MRIVARPKVRTPLEKYTALLEGGDFFANPTTPVESVSVYTNESLDDESLYEDPLRARVESVTIFNEAPGDPNIPPSSFHGIDIPLGKPFDILRDIKTFNDRLNVMEYIAVTNTGRVIRRVTDEAFMLHRTLTPDKFLKYNGGVCWDYVAYEASFFSENFPSIRYKTFFVCFNSESTHTFLLFYTNNRCYWFESSWKSHVGLYEFKSEKDALVEIYNTLLAENSSIDKVTESCVLEYNALDPRLYNITPPQYMRYMANKLDQSRSTRLTANVELFESVDDIYSVYSEAPGDPDDPNIPADEPEDDLDPNIPADDGPIDTTTADDGPIDTTATDDGPIDTTTTDDGPIDTTTTDDGPIDTTTTDEPAPASDGPIDTTTADDGPIDTTTSDAADDGPIDTTTADDAPVDTTTTDTPPADDGPIDTTQTDAPPADDAGTDAPPNDTADEPPVDGDTSDMDPASAQGDMDPSITTGTDPKISSDGAGDKKAQEGQGAGSKTELEAMRRFNLYKKFLSLHAAMENYCNALDTMVYEDDAKNMLAKKIALKMKQLDEILYDFMLFKFESTSYIQATFFFKQINAAVYMCFDALTESK